MKAWGHRLLSGNGGDVDMLKVIIPTLFIYINDCHIISIIIKDHRNVGSGK